MVSPIWEPLEAFAKTFVKQGKLRPLLDIRDGVIQKVTLKFGEDLERSWTLEDVRKKSSLVA